VANHLARSNSERHVEQLVTSLASAESRYAGAVIHGLSDGWRSSTPFPNSEAVRAAVKQLLTRLQIEDRVHLIRLASHSGDSDMQQFVDQLFTELSRRIEDQNLSVRERAAAADSLLAIQPDDSHVANIVLDQVTPQASPELCTEMIRSLQKCIHPNLGSAVLERAAAMTPSSQEAAFDLLITKPELTDELLDAIESGTIQLTDLSLSQKQRLNDYPRLPVRERARKILANAQGIINADRKQVLDEFSPLAETHGDATKGKDVFTKNCAVCHRFLGEGNSVGPDLTGMGMHGKEQLLVHILDPNRDVEGNYQAYTIVLAAGRVLNGLMAGESATSIDLIDNEGKRQAILREDIDELMRTGRSLMPEGFEKQVSRQELADLLEFLTQRRKFMPLDLHRVATISSTSGMFQTPGSKTESLVFDDWGVKTFGGVPFYPIDPQDGRVRNVVMLHGELGTMPPKMPRSVELPCGVAVQAIHFLSGISGWGFPASKAGTTSMIVRLRYSGGNAEDHPLVNGVHFADYNGHTDVKGSQLAFSLGRQQLRYFTIKPERRAPIETIELVKGHDATAPLIMAVTVEQP
jgi:putative heme-binding domain-containing protein